MNRRYESILVFTRVITTWPLPVNCLASCGKRVFCIEKSLALNPDSVMQPVCMFRFCSRRVPGLSLNLACQRLDSQTEKELAARKCPSEQPFLNFTRHADPAMNLRIARAWSQAATARISRMGGPICPWPSKPQRWQNGDRVCVRTLSKCGHCTPDASAVRVA
jgi:hypothetical protein